MSQMSRLTRECDSKRLEGVKKDGQYDRMRPTCEDERK